MIQPDLKASLESATRNFLSRIEELFGPRDPRFPHLEIQRWDDPLKGPRPLFQEEQGRVTIMITAKVGYEGARWEVAHECVHLVDPWMAEIEGRETNLLEEGLATWFQNTSVLEGRGNPLPVYKEAESLVRPYMSDFPAAIKRIRTERIRIGSIQPHHIARFYPRMDSLTAQRLCERAVFRPST